MGQYILSSHLYSFMPFVGLSPHQDIMIDMSRSQISSFSVLSWHHTVIITRSTDDDPPDTDYNFGTKGSGFITAKMTLQTGSTKVPIWKPNRICVQCEHRYCMCKTAVSSSSYRITKTFLRKKTAKFFHLSHTPKGFSFLQHCTANTKY